MRGHGEVEDYTNAFLGMAYIVLVPLLVVVWGLWGYLPALAICAALHLGIRRLGRRRAEAAADWERRVAEALERSCR